MTTIQQPTTEARLNEFVSRLTAVRAEHENHGTQPYYGPVTLEHGRKNIRVVVENGGSRSVYCFIEADTGNILKAAGWKAPAKGARGNIWNDDCDVGADKPCNNHGSNLYR